MSPADLPIRFKISVSETTPIRRPLKRPPGMEATLKLAVVGKLEERGDAAARDGGGIAVVAGMVGVDGALFPSLGASTSHILWALVARIFATVCARVE